MIKLAQNFKLSSQPIRAHQELSVGQKMSFLGLQMAEIQTFGLVQLFQANLFKTLGNDASENDLSQLLSSIEVGRKAQNFKQIAQSIWARSPECFEPKTSSVAQKMTEKQSHE